MVLFARADELEVKCEARPGRSHIRPRLDPRDPHSEFVPLWGVDCPPCEQGHLRQNPHWARNRHRIPLTPDQKEEAEEALKDAARIDAELKLIEARERASRLRDLQATDGLGLLPEEQPVITTAADAVAAEERGGGSVNVAADRGADYRALPLADLRKICGKRGLPTTGNKADVVARLVAYDTEE